MESLVNYLISLLLQIDIDDRIIYSGSFTDGGNPELVSIFAAAGAKKARFLSNAVDTRTQGVDIVLSHRMNIGEMGLRNSLAGTISKNEVTEIRVPTKIAAAGLSGDFFDAQEEAYLTIAQPSTKFGLTNALTLGNGLEVTLRNTYFGSVSDPDEYKGFDRVATLDDSTVEAEVEGLALATYDAKIVTDLSLSYPINDGFRLTLGANNLLDVYPSENRPGGQSNASFPYSRRTSQFGFLGRYVFVKAAFNL